MATEVGAFSVDVEDWYHPLEHDPARWSGYEDRIVAPTGRLLQLLAETGNRATFFVLGCIAERHPDLVRRIADEGHEVGCHGHFHRSLKRLDPRAFREDLQRALDALARAGSRSIISFRAPYFSIDRTTSWALPILAEHGFRVDSSVFPLRLPLVGYYGDAAAPNTPHRSGALFEFPITLPGLAGVRMPLTGGFYSRFFPAGWTEFGVRRVAAAGEEPAFFVHPWELDEGQPRVRAGRFLTFRHYCRLHRTEAVVRRLLSVCRWRSYRESLSARGWH